MQDTPLWQVTERPNGTGTVYDDDCELATVTYQLLVEEQVPTESDDVEAGPTAGQPQVTGSVCVVSGRTDLIRRGTLTLHLRDSRRLDFIVASQPGVAAGPLPISAVGSLRSVGGRNGGR